MDRSSLVLEQRGSSELALLAAARRPHIIERSPTRARLPRRTARAPIRVRPRSRVVGISIAGVRLDVAADPKNLGVALDESCVLIAPVALELVSRHS